MTVWKLAMHTSPSSFLVPCTASAGTKSFCSTVVSSSTGYRCTFRGCRCTSLTAAVRHDMLRNALLAGEVDVGLHRNRKPLHHPAVHDVILPVKRAGRRKISRNAKWIIEQVRSQTAAAGDVPKVLEKWVKGMRPRRSDWLSLLKEFQGDEDWGTMLQIMELALLEDTFETNIRDYTKLISGYIKIGRHEDAERTVKAMHDRGIGPDLIFFTVLLDMHCKRGRIDKAEALLNEMKSIGIEPDTIAYSCLVNAYCLQGQPREAEVFLKKIEAGKVIDKIKVYISLIKGYGSLGQAEDAERIFRLMQLNLIFPNNRAYSVLMDAYIQANDLESAGYVLDNLLAEGFEPEDKYVAGFVDACAKNNMLEEAVNIILKLEHKSMSPGIETLSCIASWFGKLGLVEEVELLFEEILKRKGKIDTKICENMHVAYVRAGLL